jgi:hypothetical protein
MKVISVVHVVMIMDGLLYGLGRSHQDSPNSKLQKARKVGLLTLVDLLNITNILPP